MSLFDLGRGRGGVPQALSAIKAPLTVVAIDSDRLFPKRLQEEIVELTKAGCIRLFDEGCDVVVLACNTAASVALRQLQQTWLPGYRRALGKAVNILGIVVPTIEAATGLPWEHEAERRVAAGEVD